MRVTFHDVAVYASKRGRCSRCGTTHLRRRRFWQTLNPYNRLPDGTVKSVADIRTELADEALRWKQEPIAPCVPRATNTANVARGGD